MEAPTRQTEVTKPTHRGKRKNRRKLILSLSATVLSIVAILVSIFTYTEQESANRLADEANDVAKEALTLAKKAEEGERLAREQVYISKVVWYPGQDDQGNESVVIVNHNPEAIYDVELTFDEGGRRPTFVSIGEISGCEYWDVPLKVEGFAFPDGPINLHLRDSQGIRWVINNKRIRIKEPSELDRSKFSDVTDTMWEHIEEYPERNCLAYDR